MNFAGIKDTIKIKILEKKKHQKKEETGRNGVKNGKNTRVGTPWCERIRTGKYNGSF